MLKELVHYLRHINTFWSTLVDGDRQKLSKIGIHTVEILQLMAPAASKSDAKKVEGLIAAGEAFQEFSKDERAAIWTKLSESEACQSIIPSLFTFFRDVIYLQACADGIKQLVVLSKDQATVRAAMKRIYVPSQSAEGVQVQTSEKLFRDHACSTSETFELAYRQLWLFAMRHYPQLARKTTSKRAVAKANSGKPDGAILYNLAILSQNLGFRSATAVDLVKVSPDRQIALEALLKARKPDSYQYDINIFESLVERVVECFACAVAHESGPQPAEARVTSLKPRCGPPRETTHILDQSRLFLDQMHFKITSKPRIVTSFYVRQCVYFAFFGRRSISPQNQEHSRETAPSSPLFVPVHSSPMIFDEVERDTSHSSARELRRDERRKRREQKRKSRQRKNELRIHRRPLELDISTVVACTSNTNEDTAMEDPVQLPVANFTPALEEPEIDLDMDERSFIDRDTEAEISMSDSGDRGIEDGFASELPYTKSISPLSESNYEPSVQDEPERSMIQEDREASPSEPNSFDEYPDRPIQFTDSGQVAGVGELEQLQVSDTQTEICLDEFQVNENREARILSSPFPSANSTATDEIQATENEIQEALRTLEEEAQIRAQDAQFGSSTLALTPVEPACNNEAETMNPAPAAGQGTEEPISTELQVHIPTSNELIQQGQTARDIRAAKRATRFNFRQAKAKFDQPRQADLQIIRQAGQQDSSVSEGPSVLEAETRKKRRQKTDQNDDMVVASVDNVMDTGCSPPQTLQPQQVQVYNAITITFRYYEKRKTLEDTTWPQSDQIMVEPDNFAASSEVQRLVEKYARKKRYARFYNRYLRKVTSNRCVQAAIEDGSYTVFMSLGEDLEVTKEKLEEVAEVLEDEEL